MKAEGYIKSYRPQPDDELYFEEPFTKWQAWHDLLYLAAFKDTFIFVRGIKVEIKRGQVAASERTLADKWKWSRGKVRRFLELLTDMQRIVPQETNVTTLISIVNYCKYQDNSTTDDTTDDTTDSTTNSTTDSTNKKNVKECKEDIEKEKVKKEKVVFVPDQDDEWDTLLVEWLEYKRQRKESYKSQMSIEKCKTHLKNLAGNDLAKARIILDYSMASNYSGLFVPKDGNSNNPSVNPNIKDGRLLNSYKGMIADDPKIADRMGYPPLPYDDIVDGVKKTIYIYQH